MLTGVLLFPPPPATTYNSEGFGRMKYAQLVIGPAGTGKSTYCKVMAQHAEAARRSVHVINLDPAAEHFAYKPSVDIRDLIMLDEVMEELEYGPNGGLVYCMEFLVNNIDWLEEALGDYQEDYLILDCPGQIELYTHFPVMNRIKDMLAKLNYRMCVVYLIDSQYTDDPSKFLAGSLTALSTMVQLELPHINVLTKVDIFLQRNRRGHLEQFLDMDTQSMIDALDSNTTPTFHRLNNALASLLDEYSMVNYLPLNIGDDDSISTVFSHVDHAMQFGEDEEPHEPKDVEEEEMDDE